MSKLPSEQFVLLDDGFKLLKYLDNIEGFSGEMVNAFSGPAAPITDRILQYNSKHEDEIDRYRATQNYWSPSGIVYQMATNERIKAREHITEDLKLFDESFPKLNLNDQYHQIELLRSRQAYLEKEGMKKDYIDSYANKEKQFSQHMTKSLVENVTRLNTDSQTNKQSIIQLQKSYAFLNEQLERNDVKFDDFRKEFAKFVAQSKSCASEMMQQLIYNYQAVELNQEQISMVEKRLSEFEYKYNKDQIKTQYLLYKILEAQDKKQKEEERQQIAQQAERTLIGVSDAFGAIAQLGKLTNSETLSKVGQLGQIGVSIVKNLGLLTGSFGFTAVTGLAMLGPISAIAMGGMALFSLFGRRRPSEMQQLSKQIQEFRKSMEVYLGKIIDNQQIIYNSVVDLHRFVADMYRFVTHDLKFPIDYKLDAILKTIERNHTHDSLCDLDRDIQPLLKCIQGVNSQINWAKAQSCNVFDNEKAFDLEGKLELWLENGCKRPTFVGVVQRNISIEETIIDISKDINDLSIHLLTLPLADLACQLDPRFASSFKTEQLINIKIYSMALESYNQLIATKKELAENNVITLSRSKDMLAKFNIFTDYLADATLLYSNLIKIYQKELSEIHLLIERQFDDYKSKTANNKNLYTTLNGTIDNIVPNKTEYGDIMRNKLAVMDGCRTLVCAYASFCGISPNKYLDEMPYSSNDVLQQSLNCATIYNNELKLPNYTAALPALFQTVTAKSNGISSVYLITHSVNELSILQYSAQNKWLPRANTAAKIVPEAKGKLSYRLSAETITCNGNDMIYICYNDDGKVKMSYFDISKNVWNHAIDIAALLQATSTVHKMKLVRLKNNGQDNLYCVLLDGLAMKLSTLDPQTNKWQALPKAELKFKQTFIDSHRYLSFDAQCIFSASGTDKLLLSYNNHKGARFAIYDQANQSLKKSALSETVLPYVQEPPKQNGQVVHIQFGVPGTRTIKINPPAQVIKGRMVSHCAVITNDNAAMLCCVLIKHDGIKIMARKLESATWEKWYCSAKKEKGDPDWTHIVKMNDQSIYQGLRVVALKLSGQDYLFCAINKNQVYECFLFDPKTKKWSPAPDMPQFTFPAGSVNVLPLTHNTEHQQVTVTALTAKGLEHWQCQVKLPKNIMQDRIANTALLNQFRFFNGSSAITLPTAELVKSGPQQAPK